MSLNIVITKRKGTACFECSFWFSFEKGKTWRICLKTLNCFLFLN